MRTQLRSAATLTAGLNLSHSADTLLTDTDLQAQGNTLVGDESFGGTRVQVTLTKQWTGGANQSRQ